MIVAIIPARSGSKGVKGKNIRLLAGKPLIAYSIEQAIACPSIDRVIVSTDSEEYAEIARTYGAEVPFLRPSEIAGDLSTDLETFQHALRWMQMNEKKIPDICVHLRPTCPIRRVEDIETMIRMLQDNPKADAVRAVAKAAENPFKMWLFEQDGAISPIVKNIPECYNMPRQDLPTAYFQTASIDVVRSTTILEKNSMTGDRILGYQMDRVYDIDTEEDFRFVERRLLLMEAIRGERKLTLGFSDRNFLSHDVQIDPEQLENRLMGLKRLRQQGNKIIIYCSESQGEEQSVKCKLDNVGVPYDMLCFGQLPVDLYLGNEIMDILELEKI